MVLPTEPRPQFGQNQSAQRKRFGRFCSTTKNNSRIAKTPGASM